MWTVHQEWRDPLNAGASALREENPNLQALAATGLSAVPEHILREHLEYLLAARELDLPAVYRDFLAWRHGLFRARGVDAHQLWTETAALRQSLLSAHGGGGPQDLLSLLAEATASEAALLQVVFDSTRQAPCEACSAYLDHALRGDRAGALAQVKGLDADGGTLHSIYSLLADAQGEVGRLWQENRIGVAEEHLATATTQYVIAQLYPTLFANAPEPMRDARFVGASVSPQLHELGMRMVCDYLAMDGWDSVYAGAVGSAEELLPILREQQPQVLGLSTMLVTHVPRLKRIIGVLRADPEVAQLRILVGGYPFLFYPEAAARIGADGTAGNASDAVRAARRYLAGTAQGAP